MNQKWLRTLYKQLALCFSGEPLAPTGRKDTHTPSSYFRLCKSTLHGFIFLSASWRTRKIKNTQQLLTVTLPPLFSHSLSPAVWLSLSSLSLSLSLFLSLLTSQKCCSFTREPWDNVRRLDLTPVPSSLKKGPRQHACAKPHAFPVMYTRFTPPPFYPRVVRLSILHRSTRSALEGGGHPQEMWDQTVSIIPSQPGRKAPDAG